MTVTAVMLVNLLQTRKQKGDVDAEESGDADGKKGARDGRVVLTHYGSRRADDSHGQRAGGQDADARQPAITERGRDRCATHA